MDTCDYNHISVVTACSSYSSSSVGQLFPDIYLDTNRDEHGYYITTMDFGRFVAVLSAANDFFVYNLMSRRSRVLLKYMCKEKMCRCCRRRRASSRQRSMATIEETRL